VPSCSWYYQLLHTMSSILDMWQRREQMWLSLLHSFLELLHAFSYQQRKSTYIVLIPLWPGIIQRQILYLWILWTSSFIFSYHTLANHSEIVAAQGVQLDYLGIVLLMWGSAIPSVYYGFHNDPHLQKVYWAMVCSQIHLFTYPFSICKQMLSIY